MRLRSGPAAAASGAADVAGSGVAGCAGPLLLTSRRRGGGSDYVSLRFRRKNEGFERRASRTQSSEVRLRKTILPSWGGACTARQEL